MANHTKQIIHPQRFELNRGVIHTPWWARQTAYAIVALIGVVTTAFGIASPDAVNHWLTDTSGVASIIGGVLAAIMTGSHSDYRPVSDAPAPTTPPTEAGPTTTPEKHAPAPGNPQPNDVPRGATPGHPAPNTQ